MNITTRKKLLKAFTIIQLVLLCYQVLFSILILSQLNLLEYIYEYYNIDFNKTTLIIRTIVSTVIYAIIFVLMTIYLTKKRKQPKEEFLNKIKSLKIICFIDFIFDGPLCILLIIAAYKKDDGKEPYVKVKKEKVKKKKNKVTYSKETKKKLREEKSKRRRGLISQELYEKNVKKIMKEENYTKSEN
mgnify:CR=1 FL=1